MIEQFVQFVPQEFCLACQGCCRFREMSSIWSPRLLGNEIQELLKNNIPPSTVSSNNRIRLLPHQGQSNFVCAFLNIQDNKCKIYSFRPFECQLYPFLINRNLAKVFLAVDLKCPFIKEKLESKEFKEYTKNLSGILNRTSLIKVLKNNPQIIQTYPEALDLAKIEL